MKEFKRVMKEYEIAKVICDRLEREYEANPMDVEKENEFDKAYEYEFKLFRQAVELLKNLIKCDDDTAKKMLITKSNEIYKLVERAEV